MAGHLVDAAGLPAVFVEGLPEDLVGQAVGQTMAVSIWIR